MPHLIGHRYRRSLVLPNGSAAVELLWPVPSDDRPKVGVQAWAALRVEHNAPLRQMVPSLHRIFTRKTGEVREVLARSVRLSKLAQPAGGEQDTSAMSITWQLVVAELPALMKSDEEIASIFPRGDVLHR